MAELGVAHHVADKVLNHTSGEISGVAAVSNRFQYLDERTADGREYGRWRRVLRQHPHGLTVISHYKAPPGKAWKIVGKASELGEEVYILEGAYYDTRGRIMAGPGTFMFNAPGARHGGISCDLTLFIHCCSGEPDEIVLIDLIDFEPKEQPASLARQGPDFIKGER
jgi:hypothetical protein